MTTTMVLLKVAAIAALILGLTNCGELGDEDASELSSRNSAPYCSSTKVADPRYPGWGWENNRSCRIRSASANLGSKAPAPTLAPQCGPGETVVTRVDGTFAGCSRAQPPTTIARPQAQEASFPTPPPNSFPSYPRSDSSVSAISTARNGEVTCVTIVNGQRREGRPVNGVCHASN